MSKSVEATATGSDRSEAVTGRAPPSALDSQFIDAVKIIEPSVVSITSEAALEQHSFSEGWPFDFFFHGLPPQQGKSLRRGIGSGVIVDTSGRILTNAHVVEGADSVRVTLPNNHEVDAKILGKDSKTDVAVVQVDSSHEKLTAATLGDSDKLQVGQWVIAAGSPFGLRQTVSAGIVSAVGRGNVGISEYEDFVQTDAAVNPGNSGGPLVDLKGRVVAINTAIASHSGGNNGVGFAIPIDMAKIVMDQLIRTGKVVRGYIGLYIADVSSAIAESFDFHDAGGTLVQDVAPDGPAAKAGIKAGDIIYQRDGHAVANASSFRNGIADSPPGTETTLKLWRQGKPLEVKVMLAELKGGVEAAGPGHAAEANAAQWGLQLSNPNPAERKQLSLGLQQGALVDNVQPGSPADDAGLQAGDLITAVGDAEIPDAAQAQLALAHAKGPVRLRIVREGHGLFLMLVPRGQ